MSIYMWGPQHPVPVRDLTYEELDRYAEVNGPDGDLHDEGVIDAVIHTNGFTRIKFRGKDLLSIPSTELATATVWKTDERK